MAIFISPLLSHHDRAEFEVFCYANLAAPDGVTGRLRRQADVWRDIAGVSDRAAAQMIRDDKIDILVDLNLHMAGNRARLFARKPAPVQVTWLGYPGTTGMDAIDYRLTDPRLDPPDLMDVEEAGGSAGEACPHAQSAVSSSGERIGIQHPYYSERSVCLPDSFWCYDPCGSQENIEAAIHDMPQPGPLPALSTGHVTFGCLNNFCKVSDRSLAIWAGAMAALPSSQLLLAAPLGPHRDLVAAKLGVRPDRVQFVAFQPWRQYLETYRSIDICLDTLPFNGGTTSLDSLWMGVPVLTRVGWTVVGRMGQSLLHTLGLNEMVARSDEEFVRLAVDWAQDLGRLAQLRAALRQRMRSSPLMDGARFARNIEAAYRQMWRAWCGSTH